MVTFKTDLHLLNEQTDEATKENLQCVIEKKREFEVLKKRTEFYRTITFIVFTMFLIYVTVFIVQPHLYEIDQMIYMFFGNSLHFLILFFILSGFGTVCFCQYKLSRAEEELVNQASNHEK